MIGTYSKTILKMVSIKDEEIAVTATRMKVKSKLQVLLMTWDMGLITLTCYSIFNIAYH